MSIILSKGVSAKIVSAADASGTGFSTEFVISANPGNQKRVQLHALAATDPTVLSADLESSLDAGTTWKKIANFDFVALFTSTVELVAGPLYRLNILSVITLGGTDKVDIYGVEGLLKV